MTAKLRKISNRLIAAARHIAQSLVSAVRGRTFRLIADLYRAIDSQQEVRIGYVKEDGTASERTIEPRRLDLTSEAEITVRAFDHLRDRDQTFRVDRITSADFQAQPEPTAARPAEQGVTVFTFDLNTAVAIALAGPPNLDERCFTCGAEDEQPCTIACRTAGALECIEYYATEYLKYRHLAATGSLIFDLGFAYDCYGRDLAVMIGATGLDGWALQDAAEATLNALGAPVARLLTVATTNGDPMLTAITHCVYGPGVLAEAA